MQKSSKLKAVLFSGLCLFTLSGCGLFTENYVSIPEDVGEDLMKYLENQGVKLNRKTPGLCKIPSHEKTEMALLKFLAIMRKNMECITNNIANTETILDINGKYNPYRRRYLVINKDGSASVKEDMSPFSLRLEPGHKYADDEGYIKFPNINYLYEVLHMKLAQREYNFVWAILQEIDPTIVSPYSEVPIPEPPQYENFYSCACTKQKSVLDFEPIDLLPLKAEDLEKYFE